MVRRRRAGCARMKVPPRVAPASSFVSVSVIFSMGVSVDGFVAGPGDAIDWTVPDAELHQFHNDRVRAQGAQICGRKLYEAMVYWETADQDPSLDSVGQEVRRAVAGAPQGRVLLDATAVADNTRLATGSIGDELAALKAQTDGDIGIGGATLAAAFSDPRAHRRVPPVRLPGHSRCRDAVLRPVRRPHPARAAGDTDVRVARGVPALPPELDRPARDVDHRRPLIGRAAPLTRLSHRPGNTAA